MHQIKQSRSQAFRSAVGENPPSRFLDYRHFFLALRQRMTEICGKYTYAMFSQDLGFDKEHVAYVLTNELRRLSPGYLSTIETSLKLPASERRYLRILVEYTHAEEGFERQALFERLVEARRTTEMTERQRNEIRFFTNWRHAAVFEMFELKEFSQDWEWIAARFPRPLSRQEVEESLNLLIDLGLVEKGSDGRLAKTTAHVSASDAVTELTHAGFHLQMLGKAREAISLFSHDEREFGALTLSLSPKHYKRLREDLVLFRRYALQLSELTEDKDRVVQLNMQLFPLTHGKEEQ